MQKRCPNGLDEEIEALPNKSGRLTDEILTSYVTANVSLKTEM